MEIDEYHLRYYGTILTSLLNLATWQGFSILNVIVGGQTLAAATPHLDATLGIVITGLISLAVRLRLRPLIHVSPNLNIPR